MRNPRAALRDAVVELERARVPSRGGEHAPVDARWTLIDRFERAGRRYVVAVEDDAAGLPAAGSLTPREQEVLAAAASGRSTKVIAYDLGLSDSTVRVLLMRAARRLGVASRRELIELHRAATAPPSSEHSVTCDPRSVRDRNRG